MLLAQADGGAEALSPARACIERTKPGEFVDEVLDDGRYLRFGTEKNGPVHVWSPKTLKRGAPIVSHDSYATVDVPRLKALVEASFGRTLAPDFFVRHGDPAPLTDFGELRKIVDATSEAEARGDIGAGIAWACPASSLWKRWTRIVAA